MRGHSPQADLQPKNWSRWQKPADWQPEADELHEEVQEVKEHMEERRIEPGNGKAYSFAEFRTAFEGQYSSSQVQDYWRDVCVPVQEATEAGTAFHGENDGSVTPVQHQ